MNIGRKIYYEKSTGNVLVDTGERSGDVIETTREQDFESFKSLIQRVPESVGVLKLEYGQYFDDFASASGYRINTDTEELEFNYETNNEKTTTEVFQKPLADQVADLTVELSNTRLELARLLERH